KEDQYQAVQISEGKQVNGFEDLTVAISKALSDYENSKKLQDHLFIQKSYIQSLKQSILQEAIQGKLTVDWRAQHPELISGENAAENLLKRIKAEKEQLVKEKKIKKEKPLPPIAEEEMPFELPEGWVWCKLGNISINIHYGMTASAKPNKKEVRL